jgi:enoyl-CoA hydratase/carnithine racemase
MDQRSTHEVLPTADLDARAQGIARTIASKPPNLVRHLKASMEAIEAFDVENVMRFEQGFIFS